MCRPKRQSGYFRKQIPNPSDRHLNKMYITWCLNTVKVYKTHEQNIRRILKAHYAITYIKQNFVFSLLCVSSADVDFQLNGGWDQPECPVAVNSLFPVAIATEVLIQSKICNFFILTVSVVQYQRNSNLAFSNNLTPKSGLLPNSTYHVFILKNSVITQITQYIGNVLID